MVMDLLPKVEPVTYQRNLIEKAVCELRFPTVYGLVRGKPPVALATALRKGFPDHQTLDGLNVGVGGVAPNFGFIFKDKKKQTSVTLRAAALTVESDAYRSFEDLLEIVLFAANAAKDVIDSEFFTRIGLRYINTLPYEQSRIAHWVNPDLVSPLAKHALGVPAEYSGRIATGTDGEGFLLQHGIGKKDENGAEQYVLDFDVWREDVPFSDLRGAIEQLHETEYRLFHWSLGSAAIEYMGPAKPKQRK